MLRTASVVMWRRHPHLYLVLPQSPPPCAGDISRTGDFQEFLLLWNNSQKMKKKKIHVDVASCQDPKMPSQLADTFQLSEPALPAR